MAKKKASRAARKNYEKVRKHSKLGGGQRFKALKEVMKASGATDPAAAAAAAGRKAHGQKKMTKWSVQGRKRKHKK